LTESMLMTPVLFVGRLLIAILFANELFAEA